jgi:mannose-6-phosphate isomerase-like protein (cupin superfamily)
MVMKGLLVIGASLVGTGVWARGSGAEPAVTLSAQDTQMQWGPCPPFMPAGCGLAVLHGDPSQPNADVFLRLPANAVIPEHWHTSAERMVLVAGELSVTYKGQPRAVLKPGMYAYGPAKVPHGASCGGGGSCVLFVAFESPVDAVPAGAAAH